MYVNTNGDNLFTKCSFSNINKTYYVSKLSKLIGMIDTTFIASIFYLIFATQNLNLFLYEFVII